MLRNPRTLLPLAAAVAGLTVLLCCFVAGIGRSVQAEEKPAPLPPLKVDRTAPLLLPGATTRPADPWDEPDGPLADNSACFVCHENYREEEMVTVHAKSNVGCMKCHGLSLAHRNDENNTTPPDTMYPPAAVDASCEDCHDVHDVTAREILTRWRERCPEKTDPAAVICTDCHGQHRIARRTVRWNKETRELILEEKPAEAMQ